jgi:hypothetical protein
LPSLKRHLYFSEEHTMSNNVLSMALRLATLAEAKRLPESLLRKLGLSDLGDGGGVGIEYLDETGFHLAVKMWAAASCRRRSSRRPIGNGTSQRQAPRRAKMLWKLDHCLLEKV